MAVEKFVQESFLEDALYCEEEKWGDVEEDEDEDAEEKSGITSSSSFNGIFPLLEQDLFWHDEELESLFCKERETENSINGGGARGTFCADNLSLFRARKEAVEWILRINAHYAFSALTAILAVNYLDRFLCSLSFQKDKPWMMQLAAVTCLSLAAKVEETHVPLLLDLQMEGAQFVFEAKTIQRMELLVLSSLKWRMNPVTPLSFIDHIIRRLGLKCYVHWEFLRSCENLLLSVISDSRSVVHTPSVLATATMLHVIRRFEPENSLHYENDLLAVLKINKEEVGECYELLSGILSNTWKNINNNNNNPAIKRKSLGEIPESSNDSSWSPLLKKRRFDVQEQKLMMISLPLASPLKLSRSDQY
ncbi:cyclin-D3-1-like [Andrographis paniculata]|uniref:cyclin-D3-1-like n=1 Tax=Andrographis paniculata TaxID=175694 RepID=UPI0021E9085F|nr:cyclin-D3-1-like [Andrographis paniculata]